MKYLVKQIGDFSWIVEKETGEEYYVVYDSWNNTWKCTCPYNTRTKKTCKHIIMVKQYISIGQREFEE